MRPTSSHVLAALPGVAAIALWGGYRHAIREYRSIDTTPSILPGRIRELNTDWGQLSYRYVSGSSPDPPLVLVHGWGRSSDHVWWQLIEQTDRTVVAVDLPGHGRSVLEKRFTFARAAQAIERSVDHASLGSAILVGHSMGGPIALTAIRQSGTNRFAGLVAIATSAYWVRPRHRIMVASAPYLFAPRSPIVTGAMRAETRIRPGHAAQVAADYAMRPRRRVLAESAAELMRFDARDWSDLRIPPAIWIVTAEDSVVPPADQRASANHFGIDTVEITSDHPALTRVPSEVCTIIENSFRTPRL